MDHYDLIVIGSGPGGASLVADASFFPNIGAVSPTLTIIANTPRVADVIAQGLK